MSEFVLANNQSAFPLLPGRPSKRIEFILSKIISGPEAERAVCVPLTPEAGRISTASDGFTFMIVSKTTGIVSVLAS